MSDSEERWLRLTDQEAQVNLRTVLELCAKGEVKVSDKTFRPSAATVGTIAEHLAAEDFYPDEAIASFAWPLLIQAGGLAKLESGRLQLTPKGRAALNKPASETLKLLWQRWLTHAVIDEFSRVEQIKGQRASNVLTAAKTRRQMVARALSNCLTDEWLDIDKLFAMMRHGNMSPTVARSERATWKLYLEDPQYGSLGYDGLHGWDLLEGRYTLAVLFEYAGTLGLIDLDYVHPAGARDDFHDRWGGDDLDALSHYDGLQAVRLNELGAYVLGRTDTYLAAAAPDTKAVHSLKVLPNLDVVATSKLSAPDRLLLSAFTENTGDHVWTVSATTLLTAVDAGRDLDDLMAFLSSRTDHELPSTLTTLISDIRRRAGQLTDLGDARIIACADPATAALLAHDRNLRSLCRLIGDRHLAIPHGQEPKFRKALVKLGYVMPGSWS